jgi:hypothetical protein
MNFFSLTNIVMAGGSLISIHKISDTVCSKMFP